MTVLLDFESRSRCDLKRHGGRIYWEHSSTVALCAVLYDTCTGDVHVWRPGEPVPANVKRGDELAAHNAMGFDRFAAERVWGIPAAMPWIDTSELARTSGLRGSLDALDGTKDKADSRFTAALSACRRPSGKGPDAIAPDVWRGMTALEKRTCGVQPSITSVVRDRVIAYCASDVEILANAWDDLKGWQNLEPDVCAAERAVNDRGVLFDTNLARALLDADAQNTERVICAVGRELGWVPERVRAAASSPAQFVNVTGAPNAQKETVATLDHPLARARDALASIARGKLEAGLARVSPDGRLRDTHRYYGAHTGRWSGRGMQLQNMPRPSKRFESWGDDDVCRAADDALAGRDIDAETIDVLLRATLTAPSGHVLVACDFSGVEARALAWCAGDARALETFVSGRDPYKVAAATIFGCAYEDVNKVQRQVGKVAELACGYGMGADKFAATAARAGSDLAAMGVDARDVVNAWRALHAPIVRFWRACEDAFRCAVRGQIRYVDRFTFAPAAGGTLIFLPSGRPIVYNYARVDDGGITYRGTHGEVHVYGGKIVENVIQALCRDLLADAMVRVERAGLPVVMHVHDELVCEVPTCAGPDALKTLLEIMRSPPSWAENFPADAAGLIGRRYRK